MAYEVKNRFDRLVELIEENTLIRTRHMGNEEYLRYMNDIFYRGGALYFIENLYPLLFANFEIDEVVKCYNEQVKYIEKELKPYGGSKVDNYQ